MIIVIIIQEHSGGPGILLCKATNLCLDWFYRLDFILVLHTRRVLKCVYLWEFDCCEMTLCGSLSNDYFAAVCLLGFWLTGMLWLKYWACPNCIIQTRKRTKTLSANFWGNPFFRQQNDTYTTVKWWKIMNNKMRSEITDLFWLSYGFMSNGNAWKTGTQQLNQKREVISLFISF